MTNEIVSEGRHKVRRLELPTYGRAGTGTEQIGVLLEIVDGDHRGQLLTWYGFFTPDTEESTLKGMKALGWEGGDSWADPPPDAIAVVQHEQKDDGWIAKVRWVNPIGVAMKDQMNAAERASFLKRITATAARLGQAQGQGAGSSKLPDRRQGGQSNGYRGSDRDVPPPSDDDAPPFQRNRR